jgi:Mg2+ and Co2+ transporter CorA
MFEASIGIATGREAELSAELWNASSAASLWLKTHGQVSQEQNPEFLDKFLDFGPETKLLAEVKDIRDELNMLSAVLDSQRLVLAELGPRLLEICGLQNDVDPAMVLRKFEEERKLVELNLQKIQRLDRQAAYVYDSASRLLDLKQKHANPFEARLAREQAAEAARTGKMVMIFTIVTIIFLPISFITSFFTIEIAEFPRAEGSNALQLSFVMKYIFGVGFAVSIPLIVVAFVAQNRSLGFKAIYERWQDQRKPDAPPAAPAPIKEPETLSV